MLHTLTTSESSQYSNDGYFIRNKVFIKNELSFIREAVEDSVKKAKELSEKGNTYWLDGKRFVDIGKLTVQFESKDDSKIIKVIEPANLLNKSLDDLIRDKRLVEPIKGIIGADRVSLWTNKLNLKRPREGSGFGWHQDSPYWIHDCSHVNLLPNVYVALDDSYQSNGCFRVIKGSHKNGCLIGKNDGTQLGGFYTNPELFDLSNQVPMEVNEGSVIFFNPHIVHGSDSNVSDNPRRAFIITYQPADYPALKTGEVNNI